MSVAYVSASMSDPRYRPRRYSAEPSVFGKARAIAWLPVPPGSEDQHLAAQMQHVYAVAIATEAKSRYGSLKGYARAVDVDYQRLAKILRGEAVMRLEDIASARLHLGPAIPFGPPPGDESS